MSVPDTPHRFGFGKNWRRFLSTTSPQRISDAQAALKTLLGVNDLHGRRFLDVGSGSGLSSLAACQLGATVVSFDFDPESVACTEELKRRFATGSDTWTILRGSVLDATFLSGLGAFDVVYSWGVLHHTGAMWKALENLPPLVAEGGLLALAIYNDQGHTTNRWKRIKQLYGCLPSPLNLGLAASIYALKGVNRVLAATLAMFFRLVTLRNPLVPWGALAQDLRRRPERGMHGWYDVIDWVGGWPFEVAKPEAVFRFVRDRGFALLDLNTCGGGLGCNEFVFRKDRSVASKKDC